MRTLLTLIAVALLPGCIPLPEPDAPDHRGVFGYVRLQLVEGQDGIAAQVIAVPGDLASGAAAPSAAPSVATDKNGNFTLPLSPGPFRVCLLDGATLAVCDCDFVLGEQDIVRRDLIVDRAGSTVSVSSWTGTWTDAARHGACAAPQ